MTIIVFLVDTSASMQQKAFVSGRSTLLDVAKGAVEFFVKMRQKSPESRGDRYMLLTFEEFPRNIKAGWKENLQTFMNELKNLEANGMTTMGSALKQVFDTLNINRMQTGIDMYGQGRYPFYLEPAVIIVISDGGKLTTQGAVQSELNLPMNSTVPGSELTREPFRWDQRMYALVLRMAGTPPLSQETGHVASDHSPIDAMCEVTGGRSYAVTSQRVLHQCIDSLVQKLQSGVVVLFEKIGADPPPVANAGAAGDKNGGAAGAGGDDDEGVVLSRADTMPLDDVEVLSAKGLSFNKQGDAGSNPSRPHTPNPILSSNNTAWHSCRRLIYVTRSAQKGFAVGFWPLPEAFWPDVNAPSLPQRSAHPKINFTCVNQEPMIIDNLPFDKYELEPSPLTLYILARKQPKVCWQVYIQGSSKSTESGHPFGYLKASTNLLSVNLFVLPYNYPVLLPLLDELFKAHRLKPTNEWRTQFQYYLRTMPHYYAGPLRRALTRMGAGNLATSLIPETMDSCLSYTVLNYLKRLKNQAKLEYDKTLSVTPVSRQRSGPDGIKVVPLSPFKKEILSNHMLKDRFGLLKDQLTDFPGFLLGIRDSSLKPNRLRNPFDIPRYMLLDQLVRMRSNYLQPCLSATRLVEDDSTHSLPISQMGNYQDYLKKMPTPLREIESQPVRQHMFGNPFKINKNMILDEVVDEVPGAGGMPPGGMAGMGQQGMGMAAGGGKAGKRQSAMEGALPPQAKRAKKGPLPKDYVYRRTPPSTPSRDSDYTLSPPGTPTYSVDYGEVGGGDQMLAPMSEPVPQPPHQVASIPSAVPPPVNSDPIAAAPSPSVPAPPVPAVSPAVATPPVLGLAMLAANAGGAGAIAPSLDADAAVQDIVAVNGGSADYSSSSGSGNSFTHSVSSSYNQSPANYSDSESDEDSNEAPPAQLARAASFSLSQSQEDLMASEIAGMIGSGGSGHHGGMSRNPINSRVNGNGTSVIVNGNRGSRNSSPKPTYGSGGSLETSDEEPESDPLPPKEELRSVILRNQNMRQMIYKEVKRPGKKHDNLFAMLKDLQGPRQIRRAYIKEVISEARRFKRRNLAELLEGKMEQLVAVTR